MSRPHGFPLHRIKVFQGCLSIHKAWQSAVKQSDIYAENIKVPANDKIFKNQIRFAAGA